MDCEAVTGITNEYIIPEGNDDNDDNDGAEVGHATALTVTRMLII